MERNLEHTLEHTMDGQPLWSKLVLGHITDRSAMSNWEVCCMYSPVPNNRRG